MPSAKDLIMQFEGCRLKAYPDPATGGKPWTVGYGCTGPGIGPDTEITQAQAEEMLAHRLSVLEPRIRQLAPDATDCQIAALTSFAYNVGDSALARSTLLSELNAGNVDKAANALLKWVYAAGRVLPGLVTRREAERAVFLGQGIPSGQNIPHSST